MVVKKATKISKKVIFFNIIRFIWHFA